MILFGSYVCYTQRIHWIHFEAFIVETYVQLVATELRATLLADSLSLVQCFRQCASISVDSHQSFTVLFLLVYFVISEKSEIGTVQAVGYIEVRSPTEAH